MLEVEVGDETLAVEARFRALAGEWDLGPSQAARLLGVARDHLGFDLVPRDRDRAPDAERRLRLLVAIRGLLHVIVPDVRDVPMALRDAGGGGIVDADGEPIGSMLEFMAGPVEHLEGLVAALSSRREW